MATRRLTLALGILTLAVHTANSCTANWRPNDALNKVINEPTNLCEGVACYRDSQCETRYCENAPSEAALKQY